MYVILFLLISFNILDFAKKNTNENLIHYKSSQQNTIKNKKNDESQSEMILKLS